MLRNLKEQFINQTKEKSVSNYSRKVEVFIEYLENECGVNDKNYKEILNSIGPDKIVESVEFYVHKYGIKFLATIDNYITSLKSFFAYLISEHDINNQTFDRATESSRLDEAVKEKTKELELDNSNMKEPISNELYRELLIECDRVIDVYNLGDYEAESSSYKPKAGLFISAVAMKLVMLTGIKNRVCKTIKKNDYNFELNKIKINGYWIHLPDKLAYDMKKYYKVREEIIAQNGISDSGKYDLFIKQDGRLIEGRNISTNIYKVMEKLNGTSEGEALCKYVIMKHIEGGMDIIEIINLTTFSIETCMHCKEQLNIEIKDDMSKFLNAKLKKSDVYDFLNG